MPRRSQGRARPIARARRINATPAGGSDRPRTSTRKRGQTRRVVAAGGRAQSAAGAASARRTSRAARVEVFAPCYWRLPVCLAFFVIRICCLCTAHGTTTKRSREALSPTFCRRVVLTPRFCFGDPWRPCIVFGAGSLIFKFFFDFSVVCPILGPGMAP